MHFSFCQTLGLEHRVPTYCGFAFSSILRVTQVSTCEQSIRDWNRAIFKAKGCELFRSSRPSRIFQLRKLRIGGTNSTMFHAGSSCRSKVPTSVRTELELLYARRSAVTARIKELECYSHLSAEHGQMNQNLDIHPKPCNLTSCRNA